MPQLPQGSRKIKGIHLVLLFSLALNVIGIWYGLPSYQGWAPDEILPNHVQEGISKRFSHDWYQKYPPLQYYLLALMETPVAILAKVRGLGLKDLSVYSLMILAGRLLSLFMAAGIVFLVYRCGREIVDQKSSLGAASVTALLIPFVYYAKTANLDVPYLFWFMISVYYFLRLLKTRQTKYYLLLALTAVLTVCTKDQAYGLYILPPLFVLLTDWRTRKKAVPKLTVVRFITNRTYLGSAAVALGAFFLVHNLAFNAQGFLHHVQEITGPVSKNYQLFPNTLSGHVHLVGRALDQIRFSLGWPLFAVCVAGLFRSLVSKPKNVLLLSLLCFVVPYDILYIHVIRFNYARYYLPVCFILSFFGGQFLASALEARPKSKKIFEAAAAAIFLYSVLYALSLDIYMVKDSRYTAEKWIRQNIPREATIGAAVLIVYAPRLRGYPWFPLELSLANFRELSPKPDFVVVNSEYSRRFLPNSSPGKFFREFYRGEERYKRVFQYKTPLSWLPLKHDEILGQINTINPEILIYKKMKRD